MSVEDQALIPFLLSDANVAACISTRLAPAKSRQSATYPRMTYQRISTEPRILSSSGPGGFTVARIQLVCWGEGANGYLDAKNLADKVRVATGNGTTSAPYSANTKTLMGYKGTMGSLNVLLAKVEGDMDSFAPPVDLDDEGVYSCPIDVIIKWVEPTS